MPTFVQLLWYLLNELLHKGNCTKVGMAFKQLAKNELSTILLTEKT